MAEELKRVGLVFKADGSVDFTKSLKEVNASIQENRSAFKLAQAQWDSNTKSADKLKDRQKYLAEQTKDYGDKVKMLESQLEDLENAEEKDEAAIQKKKNQLNNTKAALKNYEKGLKEVSDALSHGKASMEEYAKKIENVGNKAGAVGKEMTKKVTAPLLAAGVASGKMALDFEDSMANINTLLDDPGHLDGYEKAVLEMSNKTRIDLKIMGDGMYQAISSIGDGGKETEKIFETMSVSAKAGGAEVADSVSLISAGMKGYNSVNDETAKKISDLAFQTAKLGVTTFPEMARSMQPLFPLSNSLNISYEELFGSMATLTGVTGNTSEVSTQLKAVFSNLMKPTKAMGELMEKYGYSSGAAMIQSEGLEGVLKILQQETGGQSDQLAKLFSSTEALTAVTALTGSQYDAFKEKTNAMTNATGATSVAYEKTKTKADQLRTAGTRLKNTTTELGAELLTVLAPIIEIAVQKVEQFTQWYSNLDDKQKKTITTVGLLAASIGPLLMMFNKGCQGLSSLIGFTSKTISLFSKLPGIFSTVGTGAKVLWGIMAANPIGAIVTVIGLLITALVTAYNKCEWFRDGVNRIFGGILKFLKSAANGIKNIFDFEWKLPDIKLPHFSISGKFSFKPPSVPRIHVKWYAKAMNQAYMLKGASIFGQANGNLLGGGEVGNEMIMGEQYMIDMIQKASGGNNGELIQTIKDFEKHLFDLLLRFFPEFINDKVIISDREFKRTLTEMGVVFQ